MLDKDYEYKVHDKVHYKEQQCKHDPSKVAVKAGKYIRIGGYQGSDSDV